MLSNLKELYLSDPKITFCAVSVGVHGTEIEFNFVEFVACADVFNDLVSILRIRLTVVI